MSEKSEKKDIDYRLDEIEYQLKAIKSRDARMQADSAWSKSMARKIILGSITYVFFLVFFIGIGDSQPFTNAVIPTLGFIVTTMTLDIFKDLWIKIRARE